MPMTTVRKNAFTLVELLVVISIIVVLISLLLPAVEQAVYQAQLAKCGANMKGIGLAVITYTGDNMQYYPKRNPNYAWDALYLRMPESYDAVQAHDLRTSFAGYMTLAQFLDPLSGGISLEDRDNDSDTHLFSNYNIYTGLPRGNPNAPAMDRVGQKFETTDRLTDPANPITYEYNIIAADRDMYGNYSASSHPSLDGKLRLGVFQNRDVGIKITLSQMARGGSESRPVDLNYLYTDGSVNRFNNVSRDDSRMAKTIVTNEDEYTRGRFDHLPRM